MQRLQAEQQTFDEARKLKNDVVQERYYNHMIDEIKKHQIKEALQKMQITKKFEKDPLENITGKFEFLNDTAERLSP